MTPEQMRALAEDNDAAKTVTSGITLVQRRNLAGESARALRAAADQLEAVRSWADEQHHHFQEIGELEAILNGESDD